MMCATTQPRHATPPWIAAASKSPRADNIIQACTAHHTVNGYTSHVALCESYEAAIRALCALIDGDQVDAEIPVADAVESDFGAFEAARRAL